MAHIDVPHDVLASRYASQEMVDLWGEKSKVRLERKFWIAILKAQAEQGVPIPEDAIKAYEANVDSIDLGSIRAREEKTRHDVLARIQEFNALAGHQLVHRGLTSRDLTDNVEMLQIRLSLKLIHARSVALLDRFARRAAEFKMLDICGRSHLVPGQTTTLGKRFATFTEELFGAMIALESLIFNLPLRGIKGSMGTQQDIADVLTDLEAPQKTAEKITALEAKIMRELGFSKMITSSGQVYPRSHDHRVAAHLVQLAAAPANFAKMVRLLAGLELIHEGGKQGGSSAMPHKMNSRTCERISGLTVILRGFEGMISELVGDQWLEGDVSCSVVRRVVLPGAFFALDGIYESAMTVLDEMEVFPSMIDRELKRFLPFLSTTRILMAAVKKGAGREDAHEAIREHSLAAAKLARESNAEMILDLWLAEDKRLGLGHEEIVSLMREPEHGQSSDQVEKVCKMAASITAQYPEAVAYRPKKII